MSKPELLRAPSPAPPPDLFPRKTQPSRLTGSARGLGGSLRSPRPRPRQHLRPSPLSRSPVAPRVSPHAEIFKPPPTRASCLHPSLHGHLAHSRRLSFTNSAGSYHTCRRPPHGSALLPAHAPSRMFPRALVITCSPPHHLPMVPGPMPGPDVKISKANAAWVCKAARRRSVGSF